MTGRHTLHAGSVRLLGWRRITTEELAAAVNQMKGKNNSQKPGGVSGRVLVLAISVLGKRLSQIYDNCMNTGKVSCCWKTAKLALIPKSGRRLDSPLAYRPICLLGEVGKVFERVAANRLNRDLAQEDPNISNRQFGFRVGRSTVDAINRVKSLAHAVVSQGGVTLVVSTDIVNVFNFLP